MKKKVLYGVAMALVATASMGTLQSCKDDLNDLKIQVSYDQDVLKGLIAALRADLQACQAECAAKISDLQRQITENDGDIADLQQRVQTLENEIANRVTLDKLQEDLAALETKINGNIDAKVTEINNSIATINSRIDQLDLNYQNRFTNIENTLGGLTNKLDEATTKITDLYTKYDTQKAALDAAQESLDELWQNIYGEGGLTTQMSQMYTALSGDIQDLSDKYDDLYASNQELWESIYGEGGLTTQMNQLYTANKEAIEELADQVDALETKYNNLLNRVDALITGILLQGTDNPVFGNFSLPMGVKSNMLFNWYGYNSNPEFNFPSYENVYTYNTENPALTKEDLQFLGTITDVIENGYLGDVALGKLYLTVNPIGHDFDETRFSLETSKGTKLPYGLKIEKSDDELYFGYTRGKVEGNGFYAADVVMPANEEAVNATEIKIEAGLKSAVKDILNDRSKRTALNLLKALYDQMSDMLPAYGVRYDWTSGADSYAVLSNYDLAVATARPLSYKFLYGQSTDKRLRTFGHLDNFIYNLKDNENLHFQLESNINFDNIKLELGEVTIGKIDGNLVITIDPIEVKDENGNVIGKTEEITLSTADGQIEGFDDLAQSIADNIKTALDDVIADLNDQLQTNVLDQIKSQIDGLIADMNDQINGKIDDFIDEIGGKAEPWFSRLNKMVDLYNKVAGKVNNILANPNHYLQVAAFYKANGNIGILSNSKKDPTVFTNGGGSAFNLFLSSYTAELICPAYEKFVAVTNVYDANGKSVREAEKASLAAMNSKAAGLNTVIDGSTINIKVPASTMKKGLTYEIVYQAVDYSGVTSTQKFYIKVK